MRMRSFTAALLTLGALAPATRADDADEAHTLRQIQRIKDSDNTEWRRIPWAGSLLDAERAAKHENRPVFLFTYDGNIDTGRC